MLIHRKRGWSVNASVTIPGWDRHGLERRAPLVTPPRLRKHCYCGVLSAARRAAARRRALLLARIYEYLPLRCPKCGEPMRIIAFVLDVPTIERILAHIGEPTQPPQVLPARSPPQGALPFDQTPAGGDWPDMDQSAGQGDGRE